jgi:hypothetical protein
MHTIAEAADMAELISDCNELPDALVHAETAAVPTQRSAAEWRVSDECLAVVDGINDYGS